MNFTKGEVIAINKPLGMTSFCALAIVRKRICVRLGVKKLKIGHAGTLDPLATGVLVLCTGKFTKRIEEFQMHGKEYTATIQLGATTPSYDMEHPVNATYPTDGITRERIEEVLKQFVGDIEQVPPTFSACKVSGQRSYDLRRKGKDVELQPKQIHIDEIELTAFDPETMQMSLRVVCGKVHTYAPWHATSVAHSTRAATSQHSAVHAPASSAWRTASSLTALRSGLPIRQ